MLHRHLFARLVPALLFAIVGLSASSCAPGTVVIAEQEDAVAEPASVELSPRDALLAERLELDPAIRTGTLANGLTYYVRRNPEPQERAELRLVVNAGSLLEAEDQRGLAHLLEHMAFNGTERFPEIELQRYLERIGMRFGPDVNAYVTFDETVYMLQVPTDDGDLLDTGLTVLREWAGSMTLRDEDVDSERGVVLEEWRSGLGAGARLRDQHFPVLFEGSRYAERLPIGLPEVVRGAPAERVRDFYRDWYRPELMAVIAVGDFDATEVEAAIRERFSDLANPTDAPERREFDVPAPDQTRISIGTDPEQTTTLVQLMRTSPAEPTLTVGDLRDRLVDSLYRQMLNARLREITQRPDAPFVMANAFQGGLVRPVDPTGMFAVAHDGGAPRALEALLTEVARARRHGFTQTELERATANVLRGYQRSYEEQDQRPSRIFASELVSHHLTGGAVPGIERGYELAQALLPTIELEEVDARAEAVAGEQGRIVIVSAPQRDDLPPPTEAQLRSVLRSVDAMDIAPYVDAAVGESLIASPPAPGSIVGESRYAEDGIIEWTLSNGVTVLVRPTDFRNDEVVMTGVRFGGTSTVPDDHYRAATHAVAAATEGGVGDFSATELERFLAGRAVSVRPFIGEEREGLAGSFSPRDLETALQLVHLYLTRPRRDEAAFEAYRQRLASLLRNRAANPATAFSDTLAAVLSRYHPRSEPLSSEAVEEIDFDEALRVYRERLGDASGFTFVFAGAVDPDSLAPHVERYLATLPADRGHEPRAVDLGIRPPDGVVERTVYRGMEPQARVAIVFSGDLRHHPDSLDPSQDEAAFIDERAHSLWERFRLHRLAEALRIVLREELREERGGVYGVGVSSGANRITGTYTLSVSFGADPERVEELVDAVFAELDRFKTAGPDQDVLDRVLEGHRRQQELNLRSNQHWASALWTAQLHGDPPQDYLYADDLRARLTTHHLRATAADYIDRGRYVQVVLLPEDAP